MARTHSSGFCPAPPRLTRLGQRCLECGTSGYPCSTTPFVDQGAPTATRKLLCIVPASQQEPIHLPNGLGTSTAFTGGMSRTQCLSQCKSNFCNFITVVIADCAKAFWNEIKASISWGGGWDWVRLHRSVRRLENAKPRSMFGRIHFASVKFNYPLNVSHSTSLSNPLAASP